MVSKGFSKRIQHFLGLSKRERAEIVLFAIFITVLSLQIIVITQNRNVLSMLPRGTEGDGPGYLFYATALQETGLDALSPQWQPGYPFLIMLGTIAGGEPFKVGLWVSTISGLLFLIASYKIASIVFGSRVARWSTILVASSGLFILNACSVNSDMLYALLFAWCVLTLLREDGCSTKQIAFSGFIAGLAYSVRQQALVLPLMILIRALTGPHKGRLRSSAIGLMSFFIAASPVLVAYYLRFGNPFYNEHYQNLAGSVYFHGDMNLFFHEGHHRNYNSWLQVLTQDPVAVGRILALNFLDAVKHLISSLHLLPIGVLAGAGLFLFTDKYRKWATLAIVFCLASSITIRYQDRYMLAALPFVMAFASAMGLHIVESRFAGLTKEVFQGMRVFWVSVILLTGLCFSAFWSGRDMLIQEDPHFYEAGNLLRVSVPADERGPFMSNRPFHIAYYAGMRGFPIGPFRLGSIDEGISGVQNALHEKLSINNIRFFIYHPGVGLKHNELAHLADPKNAPFFLELLAIKPGSSIVVYEVNRQ